MIQAIFVLLSLTTTLASFSQQQKEQLQRVGALSNGVSEKITGPVNKALASGQNFMFSPLSLWTALAMASAVVKDEQELTAVKKFLGLDNANDEDVSLFLDTISSPKDELVTSNVRNSLWKGVEAAIEQEDVDTLRNKFKSDVFDLMADQETVDKIEMWCRNNTNDLIGSPFDSPGQLQGFVSGALLVNALYFKAAWSSQFDKTLTEDADFHLCNGEKETVDMMHWNSKEAMKRDELDELPMLRFAETDDFESIELPFGTNRAAAGSDADYEWKMRLYLPKDGDADALLDVVSTPPDVRYSLYEAFVWLPKFDAEWGFKSVMNELKAAGFPQVSSLFGSLAISDVQQKVVVKVNEEGGEAAAITAVFLAGSCLDCPPPPPPPIVKIRFDRSFVFTIAHTDTDTVSFIGKVASPKGTQGVGAGDCTGFTYQKALSGEVEGDDSGAAHSSVWSAFLFAAIATVFAL